MRQTSRVTTSAPRHVLLTGVTGFVGQAVLVALLSDDPDTRVSVLVRPKGSTSGAARVRSLLRKPVFSVYVEERGKDAAEADFDARVSAIEGDLGSVPPLPDDLDVVIHSASTVSFDPPVDESFSANVAGVASLYEALLATGTDPHVVHVSTAYVNGARKGLQSERSLVHDVDWREELEHAMTARTRAEEASRTPEVLGRLLRTAEKEHGRVGPKAVAAAAEAARKNWVTEELTTYGRTRAQSLGWTDVYTMSKALGERVAEDLWVGGGHRLSVVRPSIIESSVARPYPGWIDGFKVADPLIAAYGRGLLPEFPALADSILDIIPVDHVVHVILAAAKRPPQAGEANFYQVASGARNPLSFSTMHDVVREYFRNDPLPDSDGGIVAVPGWSFPYGRQVDAGLVRRERALGMLDTLIGHLPPTERTLKWVSTVHRNRRALSSMRRYIDLYQPYTQTEVVFDDSNTRALLAQLSDAEREARGFDIEGLDWRDYFQRVHIPGMIGQVRDFASRKRSTTAGSGELPQRSDVVAVFDMQGTVAAATPIEQHFWVELANRGVTGFGASLRRFMQATPQLLRAERRDRGEFLRSAMRRYAGVDDAQMRELVTGELGEVVRSRAYGEALERIRAHRAAGHRTILITGGIDVFAQPLAGEFDEIVAGRMEIAGGRWTGHLAQLPLVDEARAAWLARYADEQGIDLSASYAYGDSWSDRSWLELVGNPRAVNPDADLFRHAKAKHWEILHWRGTSAGIVGALGRSAKRPSLAPTGRTRR